jgi:CRISPR/Cas system CMR subunit Cmr4 (Cas7 group RAMP superfamily)
MEEKEFYTVAEFAERAGITTQAVYQRLQKDLGKYCKVESGRKMISAEALELFFGDKTGSSAESTGTFEEQAAVIADIKEEMLAMLRTENARLASENAKLIEMLQAERKLVQEKDEMIASLTNRLADMVEKSNDIAKQALGAVEKAQTLQAVAENVIEAHATSEQVIEQEIAKEEKRGLRGWIQSRKAKK